MIYSAQKKKVNGPEGAKYFFPVEVSIFLKFWQKELSHYYRKKLICNSGAVNFLFLTTVVRHKNVKIYPDSATISPITLDLEYHLWLRPLHSAEKHHPTRFHTATVRPTRSGPRTLYIIIPFVCMH